MYISEHSASCWKKKVSSTFIIKKPPSQSLVICCNIRLVYCSRHCWGFRSVFQNVRLLLNISHDLRRMCPVWYCRVRCNIKAGSDSQSEKDLVHRKLGQLKEGQTKGTALISQLQTAWFLQNLKCIRAFLSNNYFHEFRIIFLFF